MITRPSYYRATFLSKNTCSPFSLASRFSPIVSSGGGRHSGPSRLPPACLFCFPIAELANKPPLSQLFVEVILQWSAWVDLISFGGLWQPRPLWTVSSSSDVRFCAFSELTHRCMRFHALSCMKVNLTCPYLYFQIYAPMAIFSQYGTCGWSLHLSAARSVSVGMWVATRVP